jgi:hypothetical protein
MSRKKSKGPGKTFDSPPIELFRHREVNFDDFDDDDDMEPDLLPEEMMQLLPALASLAENTNFLEQFVDNEANALKEEIVTSKPTVRKKKLKKLFETLQTPVEFKPGDLVEWKAGLNNLPRPFNKEIAVVINLLNEPKIREINEHGTIFSEPADMLIGIIDPEPETGKESFRCLYVDQKRFQLVTGQG